MDPAHPHQSSAGNGNGTGLGSKLSGPLVCVRCRYDLVGLSVRTVCPECGLPVRATLLAVVDPHARELRPLTRPRLTAGGMLLWSVGAVGAAGIIWYVRTSLLLADQGRAVEPQWIAMLGRWAVVMMVVSGVGAMVLVRPHGAVPRAWGRLAVLGVLLYLPLVAINWYVLVGFDARFGSPYSSGRVSGAMPGAGMGAGVGAGTMLDRTLLRMVSSVVLVGVIVCLRPCARMLAARSLVMRTGRADRQTMYAMVATVGLWSLGDGAFVLVHFVPASMGHGLMMVGTMLVGAGSLLFTMGLVLIVFDVARLCPVLLEPAPAMGDVVGEEARGTGHLALGKAENKASGIRDQAAGETEEEALGTGHLAPGKTGEEASAGDGDSSGSMRDDGAGGRS